MLPLGAAVVLIKDGRVLLTKREDLEVWCLPGGHADEGETLAEAARREMREETGLEVELERLVGVFYGGPTRVHVAVFTARLVGGQLTPDPHEVVDIGFFAPDDLPDDIMWWHRTRLERALAGAVGEIWLQDVAGPLTGLTQPELYALRDREGGPRRAFYERHFGHPGPRGEERHL